MSMRPKEVPYYEGQRVVVTNASAPFKKRVNDVLELADPDEVRIIVRKPDGTRQESVWTAAVPGVIAHPSIGVFEIELVADQPGRWYLRIQGIGNVEAAAECSFFVARSRA